MGTIAEDTLARLRVCRDAGLAVPEELRDSAIACLERVARAAVTRASRDALIRRAALLIPERSKWQCAGLLAIEAKAMARTWGHLSKREPVAFPATLRDCLHAARLVTDLPESQRQFYRVLRGGADTTPCSAVSDRDHKMHA